MVNGKWRWRIRFGFEWSHNDGTKLTEDYRDRIRKALKWLEYEVCLTFVEVTDLEEEDMGIIRYFSASGYPCWSYVGKVATNWISIGKGCHTRKVIHHETMHTLGTGVNFPINEINCQD